MKTLLKSSIILLAGALFVYVQADEKDHKHDHDHDHHHHDHITAGPNGGRVLTKVEPHLEFLVLEDRRVKITALNDDLKPIAIADQTVKATGGSRLAATRMKFTKEGDSLISDKAFGGDKKSFPVVVQIKTSADAKSVLEKFQLDLNECPTCDNLEYACECDHHHHDHDHKHD